MEKSVLLTNIELFATNKLQGKELTNFLTELEKNPNLKNEVLLQKAIISEVKSARKTELKSRLNNIPVHTASNSSSTFMKYAASVIITASIGTALYFYFNDNIFTENDIAQVSTLDTNNEKTDEVNKVVEEPIKEQKVEYKQDKPVSTTKKEANQEITALEKKQIEPKKSNATPNSHLIADNSNTDEVSMPSKEITTIPKEANTELELKKDSDIDIKNIKEESYKFHYQLKENNLFLYGNFDASPYEILEFNDKDGQKLYLYYDNSYFELKKNQPEIVKLKKIKDEIIISELNQARFKKK